MQDKSNLTPLNKKGQFHGWWQSYVDGSLNYKGHFKNGNQIGFWVWGSIGLKHLKLAPVFYAR